MPRTTDLSSNNLTCEKFECGLVYIAQEYFKPSIKIKYEIYINFFTDPFELLIYTDTYVNIHVISLLHVNGSQNSLSHYTNFVLFWAKLK